MGNIFRCGVDDCKYNQDGECEANDVEINYAMTASGFRPMCDTYEEKELTFSEVNHEKEN